MVQYRPRKIAVFLGDDVWFEGVCAVSLHRLEKRASFLGDKALFKKNLHVGVAVEVISKAIGLSIEEIQNL